MQKIYTLAEIRNGTGFDTNARFATPPRQEFDYSMMSTLLRETEQEHAKVEKTLPKHDWQDWYAVYMVERMRGEEHTREMAAQAAIAAIQYLKAAPVVSKDGVTIIDGQRGYTTLQAIGGILGASLLLAVLILLIPLG